MRIIALLCCFLMAPLASAKDLKIATVDLARLFKDYPGTHVAQKKFSDMADKKKQDLTEQAEDLQDLKKELTTSSSVYSAKQLRQKKDDYNRKAQAFAQAENQVQQDLAAKEAEMTQEILDKIKALVAKVADDNGVDLVLDSEKTVYVKNGVDLTDPVLKAFKNVSTDKDDSDSGK